MKKCEHRWFSGRMLACHAGGPGSIPGRCTSILSIIIDNYYSDLIQGGGESGSPTLGAQRQYEMPRCVPWGSEIVPTMKDTLPCVHLIYFM